MTAAPGCVAYIGIGSNLSDPRTRVVAAFDALARLPSSQLLRVSRLYRSAAWGVTDQPEFVNAAAQIRTTLSPQELIRALLRIERDSGRVREAGNRWGPRTLDLDLLVYADRMIAEPGLHVPHPHLHERAFVLLPLTEIAPDLEVPGHGPIAALLARVDTRGCSVLESA